MLPSHFPSLKTILHFNTFNPGTGRRFSLRPKMERASRSPYDSGITK